ATPTITPTSTPTFTPTVTPTGFRVYVATTLDCPTKVNNLPVCNVSVIDTASNSVIRTIKVGEYPWAVAVRPGGGGVAYVTNYAASNEPATVSVINTAPDTVTATQAEVPQSYGLRGVGFSQDGAYAFVTNDITNSLHMVNTATNTTLFTHGSILAPYSVAVLA